MRRGALLLVLLVAACSASGVVMERDGEGALFSTKGTYWGVYYPADVGDTWSYGSVRLCLTAAGLRPVLRSLEPASVVGEVRVEPIKVRTALRPWPTDETPSPGYRERYRRMHMISAMRGVPRGLNDPDGWVVRTDCLYPKQVTEAIVTMTKTGPAGGGIEGIVVTYSLDGRLHRFTIPVEFGICGTDTEEWCH